MEKYNFGADILDTYQSLSGPLQALWLIGPMVFLLTFIYLFMQHRVILKQVEHAIQGDIAYTIFRDQDSNLRVYQHGQQAGKQPAVLLLDPPNRRPKGLGED